MVFLCGTLDDGAMTESNAEQASAPPPTSAMAAPRLRRRASDRVAAGVASGIADYLNVDPLLIRVVLVGLVLFNGAGFFIYLAAWLFIPVEGRDVSIVEGWIRRLGAPGGAAWTVAWVFLAIIGTAVLFNIFESVDGRMGFGSGTGFVLALVIIVGGILLVRRNASGDTLAAADGSPAVAAAPAIGPPAGTTVVERRERVKRDPSPLGFYVLGLLLLAVGLLAAVDVATVAGVLPGTYSGVALAILGLGLVIGAWWGRARWLILVALLVVPIAVAFSFMRVPLDQGWGERRIQPALANDLEDSYQLSGGLMILDLTGLPHSTADRHVAASIGMGRLLVILPEGSNAQVNAEVGAGSSEVFDTRREGTGIHHSESIEGIGGTTVLDLEAGMGAITVRTESSED